MLKKISRHTLIVAAVVVMSACSIDGAKSNANDTKALTESVGDLASVANDDSISDVTASTPRLNIVDTAVAAETFTTLISALQATELDAVLADESKTFTVFAPTDTAFEKLGSDTINALLGDTEILSDILLYHVA